LERTKRAKESAQQIIPKTLLQAKRSDPRENRYTYRPNPVKDEEVDYELWERPVLETDLKSVQEEMDPGNGMFSVLLDLRVSYGFFVSR